MGKPKHRFVGKSEAGKGWRIWDNMQKKWWGEFYQNYPDLILHELNGEKRPNELINLVKMTSRKRP